MLLIRKSVFLVLLLLALSSLIFTAVFSYRIILAPQTQEMLRFRAEQLLFAGILTAGLNAAAFAAVLLRSRNIRRELDRLLEQSKLNPSVASEGLLRLGETGRKLHLLFSQTTEVSEKRGLKISALNNAAEFLTLRSSEAIVILDVEGRVVQVSRGYLEQNSAGRSDMLNRPFKPLTGGLTINTIRSRLVQRNLPIETETESGAFRWVPIFNKENSISYIAAIQLQA